MDCDNHKHLGVYVLSHMKQTGNLLNPIYITTNNRQGENTNLVSDLPKIASPQQTFLNSKAMCKVIGKIEIPDNYSSKKELICDECGNITNSSFGDIRIKTTKVYSDGTKEDRFICPDCEFELFGNSTPHSIFE